VGSAISAARLTRSDRRRARQAYVRVIDEGHLQLNDPTHARVREEDVQPGNSGFRFHNDNHSPSYHFQSRKPFSAVPSCYRSTPGTANSSCDPPSHLPPPQLRRSPSKLRGRARRAVNNVILHKTPVKTNKSVFPNSGEAFSSVNGMKGGRARSWGRVWSERSGAECEVSRGRSGGQC